jgi:hypothetical protein
MKRFRVRIVCERTAPRTINGKYAGGLPALRERGREGTWTGYSGPSHCTVILDGETEPRTFLGSHVLTIES